ncbi:unnamed protein product [Rotaria sp. Silwood1]|nr:unnamed protein product [Rotaria sp. Silwood1]CAF3382557.1 unnamed protein product [Rotaria sp. Silwood1]CAF3393017.1 unnamed protein product [Rotaria sp. Silwood1]CAF3398060.1 unnamed protein product [Rotaria sp. Silwood1]CAF4974962.1 unnamed protein product [Rotaria sp. Silwood1]
MSSSSVVSTILFASKEFAIYGYFFISITGCIGNICNIVVLTGSKSFRQSQCAFYLITESISDCCLLLVVLPFRISELAFDIDTTRLSVFWCKFRPMISHTLALMSFSSICFAAIDQYLSTNYHAWLRQLSTLKLAHRLVYGALIIWILYDSIFLIFFGIRPTFGCMIDNVGFSLYYSFFHFIILNGVLPSSIASLFSLLAYLNVRRLVQLRMLVIRRQRDKQLTAMVLAKVVVLVVTILPSTIFRIYILNKTVNPNDSIRIAIDQLISNIAYSLFYINSSCTFYVFLMVSPRFRRQVKYIYVLMKYFGQKCFKSRNNNQIAPEPIESHELE